MDDSANCKILIQDLGQRDFTVKNKNLPTTFSEDLQHEIDKIWGLEKNIRGMHLRNDQIFCFESLTESSAVLTGFFTAYKNYLAYRKEPKLFQGLKLCPIGVSGIVQHQSSVLFGLRSDSVTAYPNFWETAPSGGIDRSALESNNDINFKRQLLSEFEEETTLSPSVISNMEPIALLYDENEKIYDICVNIKIDNHLNLITDNLKQNEEFQKLKFLNKTQVIDLIEKDEKVVPTSIVALSLVMPI